MHVTPYPEINSFLHTLLLRLHAILRERLAGVYLFGSLAWGDFDAGSSDIDLLVVTAATITPQEFEQLDAMQRDLATTYTHAREGMLEIAYLSKDALQTFKTQSSPMALLHPGEPFHIREAGKEWLVNWYSVQEKGLSLFGPPPRTLIAPITREEFMQAAREYAQRWSNQIDGVRGRPGQAYAILTLCRAYYTCRTGEQTSKKRAAQWTAQAFPQWSALIEQALRWRENWRSYQGDEAVPPPEMRRFVDWVVEQITTTNATSHEPPAHG